MTIEAQLQQLIEEQKQTNVLLASLVGKFDHIGAAVAPATGAQTAASTVAASTTPTTAATEVPKPVAPAPVASAPATPPPPAAPAAQTTTAEVAAPPVEAPMTGEQLNEALVAEFNRLGSRDGIDAEIKKLGAQGINDLSPEQYAPLVAAVKAL